MKADIKNYLSITKKEWNGMVVLIILIALVLAAPYIYQANHKDNTINFKDFDKAATMLNKAAAAYPAPDASPGSERVKTAILFPFDPNNLPAAGWQKLGLSAGQIKVIKNYEAKGGRFYTRQDVQKIYSITPADYKRLEPYINIPGGTDHYTRYNKAKPGQVIEINSADSATLTLIRGIGPAFAMRIIRYRQRIGGFYSKEQLKEVYGIDDEKYAAIKDGIAVNGKNITRININKATFEQLRRFPYLTFKQMDAILAYHDQHGDYTSINDMKNIAILDDVILRKIEPYLIFK